MRVQNPTATRSLSSVRDSRRGRWADRIAWWLRAAMLAGLTAGCAAEAAPPTVSSSEHRICAELQHSTNNLISLSASDLDGDSLTYTITALPAAGTLSDPAANEAPITGPGFRLASRRVRYVPNPGGAASDSFTWTASDPSGGGTAGTASISIENWFPPVGIDTPAFGVTQQAPARPSPWTGQVAGYYYIDRYHAAATDTNNAYGTPTTPRKTIPTSLQAGDVVEIHGVYDAFASSRLTINGNGTAERPIYIRGTGRDDMARIPGEVRPVGSYIIMEHLNLSGGKMNILAPDHHIVLRHSEVSNRVSTGISVGSWLEGQEKATDVVIYNNRIRDLGKFNADGTFQQVEFDAHGVLCFTMSQRVWIMDNHIYRCQGDSVQLSRTGGNAEQAAAEDIFIGRNHMHHTGEEGLDFKVPRHVVASQNLMYGFIPTAISGVGGGSGGGGVVMHDDTANTAYPYPREVWMLLNEITDAGFGMLLFAGDDIFVYENVIYDIKDYFPTAYVDGSPWKNGAGLRVVGSRRTYLANNTISDCALGIGLRVTANMNFQCQNNILCNMKTQQNFHMAVLPEGTGSATALANSLMSYNLMHQAGGTVKIRWSGVTYDVAGFLAGAPGLAGFGQGCLEAAPTFASMPARDYDLLGGSPAIDAGTDPGLDDLFSTAYGTQLKVAQGGVARPQGGGWDMGAYENCIGGEPPPAKMTLAAFEACSSGPGLPQTNPGCAPADYDQDGDVDVTDFGSWQIR